MTQRDNCALDYVLDHALDDDEVDEDDDFEDEDDESDEDDDEDDDDEDVETWQVSEPIRFR